MSGTQRLHVGIVGASGYGGVELLGLLNNHPDVQLTYLAANRGEAQPMEGVFPHLAGWNGPLLQPFQPDACAEACEAVFVALPSGISGQVVEQLWQRGKQVVDLSGDLRLHPDVYREWYGHQPVSASLQSAACYGLPEWNRQSVRETSIVSNPGCYATAVLLALLPLVRHGLWDPRTTLIVDAKSGVSGAGRAPSSATHFAELAENIVPYKIDGHQHVPEIEEMLGPKSRMKFVMSTQLVPMVRGIYAICYVTLHAGVTASTVRNAFLAAYGDEPFVRLLPDGQVPQAKHVRGTNECRIGLHVDARTGVLQVFSVIDNLMKGAAGQAVQNLNLMYGFEETSGLVCLPGYL